MEAEMEEELEVLGALAEDENDKGGKEVLEGVEEDENRQVIAESLHKYFSKGVPALVIDVIDDVVLQQYSFLQPLKARGVESMVLYPLWHEEELIGILEISETSEKFFTQEFINKMEPVVSIIELALQKTSDHFAVRRSHSTFTLVRMAGHLVDTDIRCASARA